MLEWRLDTTNPPTAMKYEVEQKFRVADVAAVEKKVMQAGANFGPPIAQVDCYFAHPARDFAATDEALRIRQSGHDVFITYKGPRLDQQTKSRREIELPLPAGETTVDHYIELLAALGFSQVGEVKKVRRCAVIERGDFSVEVVIDHIDGVGAFVELEVVADDETFAAARTCVIELARELALSVSERRSYLEILMKDGKLDSESV